MSVSPNDFEKRLQHITETASRRSQRDEDFPGIFMYLLNKELFPERKIDTLDDFRKSTENLPGEVSFKHVVGMLSTDVGKSPNVEEVKSIARGLQGLVNQLNDLAAGE
tara:strand:- start:994 stop:1317 length:324 start_codon:yes stop_codon:yes gene_type:complete